jgi:uncharacterized OB-fold protein
MASKPDSTNSLSPQSQRASALETQRKHTPLPWGYDGDGFDSVVAQLCDTDGYTIFPVDEDGTACGHIAEMSEVEGDEEAKANAAFIVHACNNHYKLLEALQTLADATAGHARHFAEHIAARAAIAKATGGAS